MDVRAALAVILLVTGVPLAAGYFGSGSSAAPAPVPAAPASTPTPMPTVASPPAWTHTEPAWAGVLPGDRKWIEAAIARARPDAVPLIRHVLGRVTFRTALRPRARWAGYAVRRPGGYTVMLNQWDVDSPRGPAIRDFVVLHELGHVVDFAELPPGLDGILGREVPATGRCRTPDTGTCANPLERFADTFAKWALRAPAPAGVGYDLPMPPSIDEWGAPLADLAAQLHAQDRRSGSR